MSRHFIKQEITFSHTGNEMSSCIAYGAQQRSSACEDSEKSRRSSDARQYRYWAPVPVLEKFVKGTAAGHLVNLTNPVAQDFGAQALCREHMHDIAADYCSST